MDEDQLKTSIKVIEIFLGIILIVFLITLVFLFTNFSATERSTKSTSTVISDSYNVNSYNSYVPSYKEYPSYKIYETDKDKRYLLSYDEEKYPLKYYSTGRHEMSYGVFGNEINKYAVYVKNKDYDGGYFTVRFYLKDHYGDAETRSVTHYIKPHEEKKFFYQTIYDNEYYTWKYKVMAPERRYSYDKYDSKTYYLEDKYYYR